MLRLFVPREFDMDQLDNGDVLAPNLIRNWLLSKGRSAEIYLVLLVFFILASASKKFRQCSLRG